MSLNPEQLGLVNKAKVASSPFDIGACFNVALTTLKRDFWGIVLTNFVFGLVFLPIVALSFIPLVGLVAVVLLLPPLVIGFVRYNLKLVRGQPAGLSDCFSGFDVYGSSLLTYILMVLCVFLGICLCILPGIYLAIAYLFAWNLMAERRGSAWECLEMSRQAVTAHWGWAFLLVIVASIIAYAGIIACIIGIFATMPLYGLMLSAAYERLFPAPSSADAVEVVVQG